MIKIAIIGSGVSSVGALLGLSQTHNLTIDHYLGERGRTDSGFKYANGQLASSMLIGGLSKYWHGVIPITREHINIKNYNYLLKTLYRSVPYAGDLFIPYMPIRATKILKRWIKETKNNYTPKIGQVFGIEPFGSVIKLKTAINNDTYDAVIVCTGDIEACRILSLNFQELRALDHVNGFLGHTTSNIASQNLRTYHSYSGYSRNNLIENKDCIINTRPMLFSPNKLVNAQSINYGVSSYNVFSQLVASKSVDKVHEAIYNRYGHRVVKTTSTTLHFQKTVDVNICSKQKLVELHFDKSDFEKLALSVSARLGYEPVSYNFYPGTHIRVDFNRCNLPDNVILPQLTSDDLNSGYHHSYLKLVRTYNAVVEQMETLN